MPADRWDAYLDHCLGLVLPLTEAMRLLDAGFELVETRRSESLSLAIQNR